MDLDTEEIALIPEEAEVHPPIRVGQEDLLAVIASGRDRVRQVWNDESQWAWHIV